MKLQMIVAMAALAFLAGCSKCSQQAPTESPAVEAVPEAAPDTEPAAVEGASAESLPNSEQMNEELPPGDAEGSAE